MSVKDPDAGCEALAASTDFTVIPVIDLLRGTVVHARGGDRQNYAPIATSLSPTAEPVAVAGGLLRAVAAKHLYIADLDAIQGHGDNLKALRDLRAALPDVELWVDGGFSDEGAIRQLIEGRIGRPVIGSESQRDSGFLERLGDEAVLSLDFRGHEPLGPTLLHETPSLWPRDVLVMTLGRVGLSHGPDWQRIAAIRAQAPKARIFAAGGVRGWEDCRDLHRMGVAGALVASAIHDGRLRRS
jgi:phosphoribosylformimino-5-aminoimidazole carboxamide ribotide isomerase